MKLTPKNTLVSLLLFTAPLSTVQANTAFDCFYVGASAGQSLTTANINFNAGAQVSSPGVINVAADTALTQTLKKNSAGGSLFAGYGLSCDPLYLGAEFSLKGTQAKASANNIATFHQGTTGLS